MQYQLGNADMTIFDPKPPCFYHPIKVVFLDDNRNFLDTLELEFSSQVNMSMFTNHDEALHMIDSYSESDAIQSVHQLTNNINADTTTDRVVDFSINKMLSVIYDQARFNTAAVVVVDYEMPNMNGIEFCKKLGNRNVFKIILTAQADKDIAIKAFNDGVIDKFILKTSENLYQELTTAIQELTMRYFKEFSRLITNSHDSSLKLVFESEAYQQLFQQVYSHSQAVEYYLIDNSGGFLFLDKNATPTWLIIRHITELDEQLSLLEGYDAQDSLISAIQGKEKILFLFSEDEYKKPISDWPDYLVEAKKLNEEYYYSIVNKKLTDFIQWDKIVPYFKETSNVNKFTTMNNQIAY